MNLQCVVFIVRRNTLKVAEYSLRNAAGDDLKLLVVHRKQLFLKNFPATLFLNFKT